MNTCACRGACAPPRYTYACMHHCRCSTAPPGPHCPHLHSGDHTTWALSFHMDTLGEEGSHLPLGQGPTGPSGALQRRSLPATPPHCLGRISHLEATVTCLPLFCTEEGCLPRLCHPQEEKNLSYSLLGGRYLFLCLEGEGGGPLPQGGWSPTAALPSCTLRLLGMPGEGGRCLGGGCHWAILHLCLGPPHGEEESGLQPPGIHSLSPLEGHLTATASHLGGACSPLLLEGLGRVPHLRGGVQEGGGDTPATPATHRRRRRATCLGRRRKVGGHLLPLLRRRSACLQEEYSPGGGRYLCHLPSAPGRKSHHYLHLCRGGGQEEECLTACLGDLPACHLWEEDLLGKRASCK